MMLRPGRDTHSEYSDFPSGLLSCRRRAASASSEAKAASACRDVFRMGDSTSA